MSGLLTKLPKKVSIPSKSLLLSLVIIYSLIGLISSSCLPPILKPPPPTQLCESKAKTIPVEPVRGRLASDANLDTLKHVQIFFRHGDRSPLFDFPHNPVNITQKWPLGFGQLTSKGKSQSHELGRFLRKRYSRFLLKEFHPKEIFVQTSDFDRTIMSALSVLSGLYLPAGKFWDPSINWDPVPLRSIPSHLDNKLSFQAKCPAYQAEYDNIAERGEGKIFDDQNKQYYDFIAIHTGLSNITFSTISDLFDTLYIQHLNGFPLPDWAAKPLPGKQPFLMRKTAEYQFSMLTSTKKAMKLRSSPIIREIVKNIESYEAAVNLVNINETINKENETAEVLRKIMLYSGHDTTISTLLQALGVYEHLLIPYSAAVIIELHKTVPDPVPVSVANACPNEVSNVPKNDSYYFIKIMYRNCTSSPPTELFIPNCGSNSSTNATNNTNPGHCKLSDFQNLKKDLLIGSWLSECHQGVKDSKCPYADEEASMESFCTESDPKNPQKSPHLVEFFFKLGKAVFVTPVYNVSWIWCSFKNFILFCECTDCDELWTEGGH